MRNKKNKNRFCQFKGKITNNNALPRTLPLQNNAEYLLICKIERLNSSMVPPEEKELLDMKIRLNNGMFGYVFTINKYQQKWVYTCRVCKEHMILKKVKAHLVGGKHRSRMKMTVHYNHKFPLKEENNIIQCNEIVEDEDQTVCKIQSLIDEFKEPLVGIEYLVEITVKSGHCTYFCLLCHKSEVAENVLSHLTHSKHIVNFLVMFFPLVAKKLKALRKSLFYVYNDLCIHVSAAIEHVHGRLKPKQVNAKDFSQSNKAPLLDNADKGRHIRESPGQTFVDCVDKSHLITGGCPVLGGNSGAALSVEPTIKVETAAKIECAGNEVLGGNSGAALSVEPTIEIEPAAKIECAGNEAKYQPCSTSYELQSPQDNEDWRRRANYRYDDVNIESKSEWDTVSRPDWRPADRDVEFTSAEHFSSLEGPSEQLLHYRNTVENDDVVPMLKQLLVLEDHLGSLGPKVQDLLSEVLRMKRFSESSLDLISSNNENGILLETVNQKLLGFLEFGVLNPKLAEIATNAVEKIIQFLKFLNKKPQVDEKPSNSETYPHVEGYSLREGREMTISEIPNFIEKQYLVENLSFVEKERLSNQICSYFYNLNKFKLSEDELLETLRKFFSPREESYNYSSRSYESYQPESPGHYGSDRDSYSSNNYWTRDREYERTASTSINTPFPQEDFNQYQTRNDSYGFKYHRYH